MARRGGRCGGGPLSATPIVPLAAASLLQSRRARLLHSRRAPPPLPAVAAPPLLQSRSRRSRLLHSRRSRRARLLHYHLPRSRPPSSPAVSSAGPPLRSQDFALSLVDDAFLRSGWHRTQNGSFEWVIYWRMIPGMQSTVQHRKCVWVSPLETVLEQLLRGDHSCSIK